MNEDYFDNSAAFQGYGRKPSRGGGAFAAIVIIVAVLLVAALAVGVLRSGGLPASVSSVRADITPTPVPASPSPVPSEEAQPLPESTDAVLEPSEQPEVTQRPAATPLPPEEGRQMPSIDGIAPGLDLSGENPIPEIFEAVSPAVVGVLNYVQQDVNGKPMLTLYGTGSGFLISSEGYILTNAHVIQDALEISVKFPGQEEIPAAIIGSDKETDVAVIKIDPLKCAGVSPLACGDSEQVRVGDYVLAIGNPLDSDQLANTLTFGIISAKAREITIDSYTNSYLQTDAAINFGNSGGPLLNMKGEVIGINSAKTLTAGYDAFGSSIAAEGIGFALPINRVLEIMETLITKGQVERPGVGITVTTITETIAQSEGLPVGAYVDSVVKDGPAYKAGLLAGDVIVEANGQTITEHPQLVEIIGACQIGDQVHVKVYRAGKYLEMTILLGNKTAMDFDDIG